MDAGRYFTKGSRAGLHLDSPGIRDGRTAASIGLNHRLLLAAVGLRNHGGHGAIPFGLHDFTVPVRPDSRFGYGPRSLVSDGGSGTAVPVLVRSRRWGRDSGIAAAIPVIITASAAAVIYINTHSHNTRRCVSAVNCRHRDDGCACRVNRHKPILVHSSNSRV
ncbi:hypothetical protein D3C75_787960 [compost metagenome]